MRAHDGPCYQHCSLIEQQQRYGSGRGHRIRLSDHTAPDSIFELRTTPAPFSLRIRIPNSRSREKKKKKRKEKKMPAAAHVNYWEPNAGMLASGRLSWSATTECKMTRLGKKIRNVYHEHGVCTNILTLILADYPALITKQRSSYWTSRMDVLFLFVMIVLVEVCGNVCTATLSEECTKLMRGEAGMERIEWRGNQVGKGET